MIKYVFLYLFLFLRIIGAVGQIDFYDRLSDIALELTKQRVVYDPTYYNIGYPGGDVPSDRGVCTDVVIRAYRKMGIDLQKEMHTDMTAHFDLYPKIWGLKRTDTNIDHRRVPNLMTFFKRHGTVKKMLNNAAEYLSGDIVCWRLTGGMTHIGIAVSKKSADGQRYLIVHNIGEGQVFEDCLFAYEIIGHLLPVSEKRTITRNPVKCGEGVLDRLFFRN